MREKELLRVMARNILMALNNDTNPRKIYTNPQQAERAVADALSEMITFCYNQRITPDYVLEKEKHHMDRYLDYVDQAFAQELCEHLVSSGKFISIRQSPAPRGTTREYTAMVVDISKLGGFE